LALNIHVQSYATLKNHIFIKKIKLHVTAHKLLTLSIEILGHSLCAKPPTH